MEYRMLHYWVEKQLGRPSLCVFCSDTKKTRYEWANISGSYKQDISDWIRLCVKCHRNFDRKGVCKSGHNLDDANNRYIYPGGKVECKICKLKRTSLWKDKNPDKVKLHRKTWNLKRGKNL